MSKKYDLVLCDPPWLYSGSQTKMGAAGNHYQCMSQAELGALDVKSVLKKKAMVLMWATGPRMHYAIELIEAWGLHYRGVAFVWAKTRKDGKLISGQGVPPTFTKPTSEFLLLASTKKTGRPIPLRRFNAAQVILAPRGPHSQKPDIFRTEIEATLETNIDKLEIFGRKLVPGWDVIGDGVSTEDVATSLGKLNGTIK